MLHATRHGGGFADVSRQPRQEKQKFTVRGPGRPESNQHGPCCLADLIHHRPDGVRHVAGPEYGDPVVTYRGQRRIGRGAPPPSLPPAHPPPPRGAPPGKGEIDPPRDQVAEQEFWIAGALLRGQNPALVHVSQVAERALDEDVGAGDLGAGNLLDVLDQALDPRSLPNRLLELKLAAVSAAMSNNRRSLFQPVASFAALR